MQLEQIRYFYEIAQQKSINKAAEKLYLNQPSLSKSIKHLENEFGLSLFDRTSKGVQLTPFGEVFYDIAGEILSAIDKAFVCANTFANEQFYQKNGILNIHLDPFVKEVLFPKNALRFMRFFPNMQLSIVELAPPEIVEKLKSQQLDLAIIDVFPKILANFEAAPGIRCQQLLESNPMLLVNKRSSLAKHRQVSILDIKAAKLIYAAQLSVDTYALEFNISTSSPQLVLSALNDEHYGVMIPSFSVDYFLERNSDLTAVEIYDLKKIATVAVMSSDMAEDFYLDQFITMIFK